MHTMHAAVTNTTTDHLRISADIRFQPAAEPVDNRYTASGPEWADTPSVGLTNLAGIWAMLAKYSSDNPALRTGCAAGVSGAVWERELGGGEADTDDGAGQARLGAAAAECRGQALGEHK